MRPWKADRYLPSTYARRYAERDRRNVVFQRPGAEARMNHEFTDGGIPLAMLDETEKAGAALHKKAGSYHLDVNRAGFGSWALTIKEKRCSILLHDEGVLDWCASTDPVQNSVTKIREGPSQKNVKAWSADFLVHE